MHQAVESLLQDLQDDFPHLTFKVDPPNGTVGGHYFIDVMHDRKYVWSIQVNTGVTPIGYGFSIIDDDVGFDNGPDMATCHATTMMKYLKLLLPKETLYPEE